MIINCAHSELVEIHKLQPNPKNPNKHPDRQIEILSKIIDYQGQRAPIVVSKRSGFITKGHGRLMAIQKLGWEKAAVDFQDYENEAQEFADMVADNKIAELSQHDDAFMIEGIKELNLDSSDFELLGLEDFSLESAFSGESSEDFGDFYDGFSGESTTIKMIFEKDLWESKKQKVQNLIESKGLEDISQLFIWFLDNDKN